MESFFSQPELLRLVLLGIPDRESCCLRQLCRSVRVAYDRTLTQLAVRNYIPGAREQSRPTKTAAWRTPLAQSVRGFLQRGCRPAEVVFDLEAGGSSHGGAGQAVESSPLLLFQAVSEGAGGALHSTAVELPVRVLSLNVARAVVATFPHVTELRLTGVGMADQLAPETVEGLEALLGNRRVNLERKKRERRRGGGDGGRGRDAGGGRGGIPGRSGGASGNPGGRGAGRGRGGHSAPSDGAASGSAGAGSSAAAGAQAAAVCQPTPRAVAAPQPGLLTALTSLHILHIEDIPLPLLSLAFGNTRLTSLTIDSSDHDWSKLELQALSNLRHLTSLAFPCEPDPLARVIQPLTRLTRLRIFDNSAVVPTRIFAPLTNLTDLDLGGMQLLAADLTTCLGALTRLRARALLPYAAAALWRGSDSDHSDDDEPLLVDETGMEYFLKEAPQPPPLGPAAAPAAAGGNAPPLVQRMHPQAVLPAPPTAGATWPLPPRLRELVLWDKQQSVEVLAGLLPPAGGGMEPAGVRLGRQPVSTSRGADRSRVGGGRRGYGCSEGCVELQLSLCRLRHASPCGALLPAAEEALVGAIGTLARWLPPDRSGGAVGADEHGRSLTIFYDHKKDVVDLNARAWGGFGVRRRYGNAAAEAARLLRPVGYTYSHYDPTSGLNHGRWLGALGALGLSRLCLRGVRLSHGDLQTAAAALLNLQELCLLSCTTYPLEDLPCLAALTRLRTLRLDARCWADEEYRDASETHGSGAATEALVALYIGGSGLGGPGGAGAAASVGQGGAAAAAATSAHPGGYRGVVEMEVSWVVLMKYEQEGVRELSYRQRLVEMARSVARRVEHRVEAAAGAGRATLRVVDKEQGRYSNVSGDEGANGDGPLD